MSAVLLDTCAILWLAGGSAPRAEVSEALEAARRDDAVLVSPISAREIAQNAKRRLLAVTADPHLVDHPPPQRRHALGRHGRLRS